VFTNLCKLLIGVRAGAALALDCKMLQAKQRAYLHMRWLEKLNYKLVLNVTLIQIDQQSLHFISIFKGYADLIPHLK
jgi:hypothetical protein